MVSSGVAARRHSRRWRQAAVLTTVLVAAAGLQAPPAGADAASGTPDGATSLAVPGGREVRGLWTDSSRTWEVAEGTYRTQLFTSPVNFRDDKGRWQAIDPTLVPSSEPGFAWQNTAGPVRVLFPASLATGGVRVQRGGSWVELSLRDARGTASVEGSAVTYTEAYPGVSVRYEVMGKGVKESLILAGPSAQRSFTFDVRRSSGISLKAATGGGLRAVTQAGEPRFWVPSAFMLDSASDDASVSDAVSMALDSTSGSQVVTLTADASWLDATARVWPVVVDPTVMLDTTGGRDCYINQAAPTISNCGVNRVKVGMNSGSLRRGLLYFDPSGIPGSVVSSAQIDLWCDQDPSPPAKIDVQVRAATVKLDASGTSWKQWGTNDTTSWQKRTDNTAWKSGDGGDFGSNVYATGSLNCGGASGYRVWSTGGSGHTVTELVQKWVNGSLENDGVVLKTSTADESTATLLSFHSAEASNPPVLEVTSTRPSGLEGGGFQNVIAVNPINPNIVVSGGDVAGVHLSRDGGWTWTSQDTDIPGQQYLKVAALAWADATTLYALVGNGSDGAVMRGSVQTNEANVVNGQWITWQTITSSPVGNGGDPYPDNATSHTGLPGDPALPQLKVPGTGNTASDNPKLQQHPRSVGRLLVVDASQSHDALYVGSYNAGVWRATLSTITTAPNWTRLGLNNLYVRSIDLDAASNVLYASTYRGPIGASSASDGQVWRMKNASAIPTVERLTGSPVNVEEIRVLAGTLYGVADGRDGPGSVYTETINNVVTSYIDPAIDATYQRGLFRLPNAATALATTTWTQISHTLTVGTTSVTRPDVSAGFLPDGTPKNQIWYSLDGYASDSNHVTLWMGSRNPAPEVSGGQYIALTRISTTDGWVSVASSDADPQSAPPTTVLGDTSRPWWVATARPAYMLGNGTFTASDVAVAPTQQTTMYVAGRSGVWKSSNGGTTWAPAVRSMAVTINRQVLLDLTNANNVDIGNVDFQYITSADRMQTVSSPDNAHQVSSTAGVSVGYALTRDPVSNALIVGLGDRDTNTRGEVRWKNPSTGIWDLIRFPSGTTQKPIGLLGIQDKPSTARSVLAAVAEQGVYQSTYNATTGAYGDFVKLATPTMLQDATLKRASFVQGAADSKNVYLYDKTQGVFRGTWTYSNGSWSWTWTRILHYPSTGSSSSPAAGDGSGYLAPDTTDPDVLYGTSGGDGTPTYPARVFMITSATTLGQDGVPLPLPDLSGGRITDPGPIDVDKDGFADADGWASIVVVEPATSAHPVQLWSVNPANAGTPSLWNFRQLDGLTAQPLIPLDLDYDPRNGNVYIATFGIGVYTAYLPMPGPA